MEPLEAAVAVLRQDGGALHWTVIQDRALRGGFIDPFATPDVRKRLLEALAEGVRAGLLIRDGRGSYRLA